jgi:putative membrane-bound dehydrogenase-like protein
MNKFFFFLLSIVMFISPFVVFGQKKPAASTAKVDRSYVLETTMIGYIAKDGTRNPVLKARKGERVRITIINGELMTHDIALEKMKVKSNVLVEKGSKATIVFVAKESDTYFCTIPGHRQAGMVGKFVVTDKIETVVVASKGTLPKKDGKPLNLNFETGTLEDWTAEGDAFTNGLISKDPSPKHEKDTRIAKEGKYFVSSGGNKEHEKTGKLTSASFKVTQPWAAFKVSGGALQDTRVELVTADDDSVFFMIPGTGRATLRPVVVDLRKYLNKEIFIRLIDNETGVSPIPYIEKDTWAHLNFDDFEFYTKRPVFSNELKPSDVIVLPPLDVTPNAGLSGEKAAQAMTLPQGFKVTLAASEPEILKPIAFTIDWRGRLWVVESHVYPVRAPEGKGTDRVYIFEDTDGDGKLDSKKVFIDTLNLVSGIEVGMGGVWIGAAPYLLYIPIDDKTDKPAGPAQVVLDGWGYDDTHETLNNLHWGPDGWLYGTHGVFTHSKVGKPGTPEKERTIVDAGVWRIHPLSKKFELFAEGTSNPWGIDFNDYGHAFITACVVPHLYHMIQGGRYIRQANPHVYPYTYDDIQPTSDHVHWIGNRGPHAGNFRSASKGGGHAHAGAMVYLGGDNWPAEYRNDIFMNSIHGSRVNIDHLKRKGSGYVGTHGNDFLLTNDAWSQWLNFRYDPSGSVFAIDWYDKNQCHSPNPDVHDKTLGRIFKISHEKDKWVQVDLSKATDMQLVENQLNRNDWYVRQSRIILQQRGPNEQVHQALKKILNENPDVTRKLRALWALHVTKGITEADLLGLLNHESEYLRSWAIQLLSEEKGPSDAAIGQLTQMAKSDTSALVRLYIASAVQRADPEKRWDILDALYQHGEDSEDLNMPLMLWYAFTPLVEKDMNRAAEIASRAKIPSILKYTVKRLGEMKTPESKKLMEKLSKKQTVAHDNMSH